MNAKPTLLDSGVTTETALSDVDGENGHLAVRGHDVERLAGRVAFEDVAALLWDGALPGPDARESLRAALASGRRAAYERLPALGDALALPEAMDALRA